MPVICLFCAVKSASGEALPKTRKQVHIDIVGAPVEGDEYLIGSCKYRNDSVGVDELELIRSYAKAFGKGSKYHYMIFSGAASQKA